MISACVVPTVKHGWCGGALLVIRFVIYFEFKAHIISMDPAAFCSDPPIWFGSGTIICVSTGNDPTHLQAV